MNRLMSSLMHPFMIPDTCFAADFPALRISQLYQIDKPK
jgi:hypothetical protein